MEKSLEAKIAEVKNLEKKAVKIETELKEKSKKLDEVLKYLNVKVNTCETCSGDGILEDKTKCTKCNGQGFTVSEK